jgi:hypothetical protein
MLGIYSVTPITDVGDVTAEPYGAISCRALGPAQRRLGQRRIIMARVPDFYSTNEIKQPPERRRYHNDDRCGPGRAISQLDKRHGTAGYKLCEDCRKLL